MTGFLLGAAFLLSWPSALDPPSAGHPGAKCSTVTACRAQLARLRDALSWQRRERALLERRVRVTFRRDVDYAIRLAATTYGVEARSMLRVAFCESHLNPYARNGSSGAAGLFQWLGSSWSSQPFAGFSPYDPVPAALATARHVSRSGWGAWTCGGAAG